MQRWSIGILQGLSPLDLTDAKLTRNPVITAADVDDADAAFVADPFMVREDGTWHMFFEILNLENGRGEIAHADSVDGLRWHYRGVVLREPFHLSYPLVVKWESRYFMIPETLGAGEIRLYVAEQFPRGWRRFASLVLGVWADPTPVHHDGRWWLFACGTPASHDRLHLFHADSLCGPWIEHCRSPIITGDRRRGRPAGRIVSWNDGLVRYSQDCTASYGGGVVAQVIAVLERDRYAEEECPAPPVRPIASWFAGGIHHLDPHLDGTTWIVCADGRPE
jgi:hypothetical protein